MQSVIEKFSDKNGVENDPEFIKIFNELKDQVKRSIKVQLFEKRIYDGIKFLKAISPSTTTITKNALLK